MFWSKIYLHFFFFRNDKTRCTRKKLEVVAEWMYDASRLTMTRKIIQKNRIQYVDSFYIYNRV